MTALIEKFENWCKRKFEGKTSEATVEDTWIPFEIRLRGAMRTRDRHIEMTMVQQMNSMPVEIFKNFVDLSDEATKKINMRNCESEEKSTVLLYQPDIIEMTATMKRDKEFVEQINNPYNEH